MIRPTVRALWLWLGCVAASLLPAARPGLWMVWAAAVASALLLMGAELALCPPPDHLKLELRLPPLLYLGAKAPDGQLALEARASALALRVGVLLAHDPQLQAIPELWLTLQGRQATVPVHLVPLRRGEARFGAVWLRYQGPLGLLWREQRRPLTQVLPISPNLPAVRATAIRFFGQRQEQSGLKVERYLGDGTEFDALREYVPGLDPRAIDWKASARHRSLLLQEYRAERNHPVMLAVDTGHRMSEPLLGLSRLDHAINASLLLGYVALRTGDRVGLYAFDERARAFAAPAGGVHSFHALQGAAAALDYGTSETNYTLGMAELSSRVRRRSLVILLTELSDSITAELMVESVQRLLRRHFVLLVALRNPELDGWVAAPPHDLRDVHRAVVAHELLRERDRVFARLRRMGAHAIDALPAQVGPTLVDRYLEIRRRELV